MGASLINNYYRCCPKLLATPAPPLESKKRPKNGEEVALNYITCCPGLEYKRLPMPRLIPQGARGLPIIWGNTGSILDQKVGTELSYLKWRFASKFFRLLLYFYVLPVKTPHFGHIEKIHAT